MYCLSQFCCFCFRNNVKLKLLHRITCSDKTFTRIATEVIPEMNFRGISNVLSTCDDCRDLIEKLYSFRDTCVKSNRLLTEYVNVLLSKGHEIGDIRIEINDVMKRTDSMTVTYGNTSPCGGIQTDETEMGCVDFEYLNLKNDIKIEPEQVFIDEPLLGSSEGFGSVAATSESFMFNRDDSSASHVEELGISGSIDNRRVYESAGMKSETVDDIRGIFGYKTDEGVDVAYKDLGTASDVESQPPISLGKTEYTDCTILKREEIKVEAPEEDSSQAPHVEKTLHKCEICGKHFNCVQKLINHKAVHTGTTVTHLYTCEICGKSFQHFSYLKVHGVKHTGERPHTCKECGKSFRYSSGLKHHRSLHRQRERHKCEDCGKSFTLVRYLKAHQAIHSGKDAPFKCATCGRNFYRMTHLNNHMMTHSGEKPHKCDICGKSFNRSVNMRMHKYVHTDERPVSCEMCGKAFKHQFSLRKHRCSILNDER